MGSITTHINSDTSGESGEAPATKKTLTRQPQRGRAADVVTRQGAMRRAVSGTVQNRAVDWPRTLAKKAQQTLAIQHLRFQRHHAHGRLLHCLLLDCSSSMVTTQMLAIAKGLLMHWTQQFYFQRTDLAVVGFSGSGARILQAPRKASVSSEHWIEAFQGGGGSPLAAGIHIVDQMLGKVRKRQPDLRVCLWVMTDGRISEFPAPPKYVDLLTIIDFENASVRIGRTLKLAHYWQSRYMHMCDLLTK